MKDTAQERRMEAHAAVTPDKVEHARLAWLEAEKESLLADEELTKLRKTYCESTYEDLHGAFVASCHEADRCETKASKAWDTYFDLRNRLAIAENGSGFPVTTPRLYTPSYDLLDIKTIPTKTPSIL